MKRMTQFVILLAALFTFACGDDDTQTIDTDTGCEVTTYLEDWVGTLCESHELCREISCDPTAFCHAGGGYCTRGCEPATTDAPTVGGCGVTNAVCARSQWAVPDGSEYICAEPCVPSPTTNPCSNPNLACDPNAGFSNEAMTATCQINACTSNDDCATAGKYAVGDECVVDSQCPDGSSCNSQAGRCLVPYTCDTNTGRCSFSNESVTAEIGDPCASDFDCSSGMTCLLDQDDDAFPNGYCTKHGCIVTMPNLPETIATSAFSGKREFDCGASGTCYAFFNPSVSGRCMRTCSTTATTGSDACRQSVWDSGTVLDAPGDYECYETYLGAYYYPFIEGMPGTPNAQASGTPFVLEASCHSTRFTGSCAVLAGLDPSYDCNGWFSPLDDPNPDLECRNPVTGDPSATAAEAYCLDNTTSGPNGDWDTDTQP